MKLFDAFVVFFVVSGVVFKRCVVSFSSILVSFCAIMVPLGVLLVTRSSPGPPERGRGEKVTEVVVCGSALESLNRHSVDTEWSFLKFVFFLFVEVEVYSNSMTLNWNSIVYGKIVGGICVREHLRCSIDE